MSPVSTIDRSKRQSALHLINQRSLRTLFRSLKSCVYGGRSDRHVYGLKLWYRIRYQVILSTSKSIQKLTQHTAVRVWVDGDEAFPRIHQLIRRAKHTIAIQMFLWADDETGREMASALLVAADRGVKVDITKEAVGDVFEFHRDFLATSRKGKGVWHRFWNHPNISIAHVKDSNHSKVFVFDDHRLLVGGMNIANESMEWHDYFMELRGTQFVRQYLTSDVRESGPVRLVLNTTALRQIRPCIRTLIKEAHTWILLEQSYLNDKDILQLLAQRSHDGVQVTLILPEDPGVYRNANMCSIQYLFARANLKKCQILLYPGMVHGKVILIDRKKLLVGSANLMRSSLDTMGEADVLIEGKYLHVLWKMRDVLRRDILKSRPLISPPKLKWLGRWLAMLGL